jgi:hypothetical protein
MATTATLEKLHAREVVRRFGRCLELVGIDPHFHDVSVGLYLKNGVYTIWTFSRRPGIEGRISQIRDLICSFGDMEPVPGSINQARYTCGQTHEQAMRFLMMECVEKRADRDLGDGVIAMVDTKTRMQLAVEPQERAGHTVYVVSATGEGSDDSNMRLRAVVGGFMRYGGAQRVSPHEFSFPCGARHDPLARLLLPYARNVSTIEDVLEAESLRGQMTTQTLGFSST